MKFNFKQNSDATVIQGFGEEWTKFDHAQLNTPELRALWDSYFSIFPWNILPAGSKGFDLGCGTGRWAYFVAPLVGQLHCIDPSSAALEVAKRNLRSCANCHLHLATVADIPLPDNSCDFAYSLGVLHHVPDTQAAIAACVRKLKPGAPFLIYLYYAFDNRPWWFRALWKLSNVFRLIISRLPFRIKSPICDIIAGLLYWPLARISMLLEKVGVDVTHFPLSAYRHRSFYSMRTDSLDRFGTVLESRFTRNEIRAMMQSAGLDNISFAENPCWCAVGYRQR